MATPPVERLEAELIGFTFQAPDGGFGVARLRLDAGAEVIAVGPLAHATVGQHLLLTGRWTEHPAYGRRFKAEQVLIDDPRTERGLERYLAGGAVKGLGPEFARRVVAAFGTRTLDVIENEPHRLLEVEGIGQKRLALIRENWETDRASRAVFASLRGLGVGQALANRIVEKYGKDALSVVTRQPYRLAAEVRGVGFRTADQIARQAGLPLDDPSRAGAALLHVLREAEGSQGHSFLPEDELLARAARLDVPSPAARDALAHLLDTGVLHAEDVAPGTPRPVWDAPSLLAERFVAERLLQLAAAPRPANLASADAGALGLTLNADQTAAVEAALTHGVCVVTGGPGTGKTTIVRVLLAAAARRQETWLLAAPTGRAARRLAEATGQDGRTLHRLLEWNPRLGRFTRDRTQPLDADGVLVDEASMLDLRLMASLLDALPDGCRLVLVGDADQLPSVGAGQVLADLLAAGTIPVATLREVYRQAADSGIVRNAWRVHEGEVPLSSDREDGAQADFFVLAREEAADALATVLKVVTHNLPRRGFDPHTDVQVLTPMHSGPLGTVALNEALQAALVPDGARGPRGLRVGDRVLQTRNDYDLDVFNGDTGRVVSVDGGLTVDFDGRTLTLPPDSQDDLEPAWAMSIHKSQGSEYPAVVVVLHRSHRIMLRRNLLYTAITRARRFCVVIGDAGALRTAVTTHAADRRYTRLAERLSVPP